MANLLPILLLAGGAAVVMSKKKKKTAKTNGGAAPSPDEGEIFAFDVAEAKAHEGEPLALKVGDMVRFGFEQPLSYEWNSYTEVMSGKPMVAVEESRPSGRYIADLEAIDPGEISLSFMLTRFETETVDKIDLVLQIS